MREGTGTGKRKDGGQEGGADCCYWPPNVTQPAFWLCIETVCVCDCSQFQPSPTPRQAMMIGEPIWPGSAISWWYLVCVNSATSTLLHIIILVCMAKPAMTWPYSTFLLAMTMTDHVFTATLLPCIDLPPNVCAYCWPCVCVCEAWAGQPVDSVCDWTAEAGLFITQPMAKQ